MSKRQKRETDRAVPMSIRGGWIRNWQRWTPYAAVVWSLAYAVMGVYWLVSGHGFPYIAVSSSDVTELGPLAGQFGTGVWAIVMAAGFPAAALGIVMLRRVRKLRPLFITTGALLTGILLLMMTDINLLILLGYTPYGIVGLFTGAKVGQIYLNMLTSWTVLHELICFVGGFLWLAATFCYARRSGDACLICGRRDGPEGWKSPESAARWGRIAVYVSIVVPLFYAFTRYAWALGFPLGITEEFLRYGQETGIWTSGLFLASFGIIGAVLTLGLIQRWGEVFPRWLIGLAGRRVPMALAIVPAAIVSVLIIVGGFALVPDQFAPKTVAEGIQTGIMGNIVSAPTTLFPVWGMSLAVATVGYYYRRRGACAVCGGGVTGETGKLSIIHSPTDVEPSGVGGQGPGLD